MAFAKLFVRSRSTGPRGRDDDRPLARRDAFRLAAADRLGDIDVEKLDLAVGSQRRAVGAEQHAGVVAARRLVLPLVERAEERMDAQAASQLGKAAAGGAARRPLPPMNSQSSSLKAARALD
jgi:hypothetical protein